MLLDANRRPDRYQEFFRKWLRREAEKWRLNKGQSGGESKMEERSRI